MFKNVASGAIVLCGLLPVFLPLGCKQSEPDKTAESSPTAEEASGAVKTGGGAAQTAPTTHPISSSSAGKGTAARPGSAGGAIPEPGSTTAPKPGNEAIRMAEWEIMRQWDKLKGFSAKITTKSQRGSPGAPLELNGHGSYDLMKTEGQPLVRMEMTSETTPHAPGAASSDSQLSFSVFSEGIVQTLKQRGGRATAQKSHAKPESLIQLGGRRFFQQLNRSYDLRLLPDATLEDGTETTVIEATPPTLTGTMTHYFDKKTGILVKLVIRGRDQSKQTIVVHDIEVDPEFSADRFVFKVPDGVTIKDLTQQPAVPPSPTGTSP